MIAGIMIVSVVFLAFGLLAVAACVVEHITSRWDNFGAMYDARDRERLPPPNRRSQRSGRESH